MGTSIGSEVGKRVDPIDDGNDVRIWNNVGSDVDTTDGILVGRDDRLVGSEEGADEIDEGENIDGISDGAWVDPIVDNLDGIAVNDLLVGSSVGIVRTGK